MRRFGGDERGVTVQIGAILLFGILVLALATYQAVAVPAQNEEVEFNHNQRVQSDMLDLRGTLGAPVAGADPGSVTVELGTTYPARVLFVDPAPPGGALRTIAGGNTTLENAVATNDETADFVDGTRSYRSRDVVYDPSYSVYQNAPTTALEGAVAVNRGEARSVAISDQRLIDGRTISLVVVRGNLSRAGSGSLAVDPRRVSTATRTPVRNDSAGPLNVTVTTSLPADRWERLLADQPRVTGVAPAARPGAVNVSLAPVAPGEAPYTLRVGVIDVGDGRPPPAPAYVTSPDAPTATLAPGDEVTVAVRDRYNNPVAGSIELTDGAGLVADDDDATPDVYEPADREDGVYRLRYTGGDGTLMTSLSSVAGPPGTATVTVTEATGTENATVESGVTEGGTSTYSPSNRTFTLASHNGRITGIDETGSVSVSGAETYFDPGNGYREVETLLRLENDAGEIRTLRLAVELKGDGDFNVRKTFVGGLAGGATRKTYTLNRDAARDIVENRRAVDLLDAANYDSSTPDLAAIRSLSDDAPVEALVQEQRGRVDVTFDSGASTAAVSLTSGGALSDRGPPDSTAETLEFTVRNDGGADLTVTDIEVETSDGETTAVRNGGGATVETVGAGTDDTVTSRFSVGVPASFGADPNPVVVAGGSKTFTVKYLGRGGNGQPDDRDQAGDTLTITLTFQSGETATVRFTG
jgi:hypothetical protein